MRKLLTVLALGLVVSCGKNDNNEPCAGSAVLGEWTSGYDRIELRPNCTGYASFCQSEFTFNSSTEPQGNLTIKPLTNYSMCGNIGSCSYKMIQRGMYLNCGNSVGYFTRR